MADAAAIYPWAYPLDMGWVSAWPSTIENPDPMLDWPLPYDPSIVGAPVLVEGSPPPIDGYMTGDIASMIPSPIRQAGTALGQTIGQGFQGLGEALGTVPSTFGAPSRIERKLSDTTDKTSQAADTVKTQANQVGDDARRTMAVFQASMISGNQHIEETSRKVQQTADAIKYVVFGIGALTTVALIFHIVKQSTE